MGAAQVSVLIVDDDMLAAGMLTQYFDKDDELEVVDVATNGVEALKILAEKDIDIVLSDIRMPVMDGLTLLEEIRKLKSPPVFVAITSLDQDGAVLETIANGGSGYILKAQSKESILQSVRDAYANGMVVSPNELRTLIREIPGLDYVQDSGPTLLEQVTSEESSLSPSEKDVLKQLCLGKGNAEIAASLQYSESAVKKWITGLMRKFGATTRLNLVVAMLNKPGDLLDSDFS